jgi:hypothetical protein
MKLFDNIMISVLCLVMFKPFPNSNIPRYLQVGYSVIFWFDVLIIIKGII